MCEDQLSLTDALDTQIVRSQRHARRNYYWAYGITLIGATASAVTTLIVALGQAEHFKEITAIFAAMPAAAMLLESRLRLEERSRWNWHKTKRLQALSRSLTYEGATEAQISKAWSELEVQLEEEWVGLSRE